MEYLTTLIKDNTDIEYARKDNLPLSDTTNKREKSIALRVVNETASYCNSKNQYSTITITGLLRATDKIVESTTLADEVFEILDFKHNIDTTNYTIISILCRKPIFALIENDMYHYNIDLSVMVSKK